MIATLEVLFAPVEFAALATRDLGDTICVVFDIFRATSTIVTALGNGADAIIPVAEIPEALALRKENPNVLLAVNAKACAFREISRGALILISATRRANLPLTKSAAKPWPFPQQTVRALCELVPVPRLY